MPITAFAMNCSLRRTVAVALGARKRTQSRALVICRERGLPLISRHVHPGRPVMLILRRKGWELPESAATPERFFFDRRAVLGGSAALGGGLLANMLGLRSAGAEADPSAGLFPAK